VYTDGSVYTVFYENPPDRFSPDFISFVKSQSTINTINPGGFTQSLKSKNIFTRVTANPANS
jgi:hypothetical protein